MRVKIDCDLVRPAILEKIDTQLQLLSETPFHATTEDIAQLIFDLEHEEAEGDVGEDGNRYEDSEEVASAPEDE